MSDITQDTVKHIANLSRLTLTPDEIERYQRELEQIIGFVEMLEKIDTNGVEPTAQVTGLENVMREDEEVDYRTSSEELLKNTPETESTYIKVRKVL